ncbi:MAG: phosphate acyltransferase PlsX [Clostridia bacterium]|nr:phosphate acyltransferase PlsX [Clostridia bacterium]
MRIIIDGFGGDNAPLEVLKGCALAVNEYGVELAVTGSEKVLRETALQQGIALEKISFIEAPDILTMEDSPREITRGKKHSSLGVGLDALHDGLGDAFVCAGNTGALVVGSMVKLGCIDGIKRPALAPIMPNEKGCFMLLDSGANVECRAQMLMQFGVMGSVYMKKIHHIESPRVGLVNIGVEESKGGDLQRDAFALLRDAPCNFVGNIEARDIPLGACDVAVADGFTGNVILKLTEGVGLVFSRNLKGIFTRNAVTMGAALLVKGGLRDFKKKLDYTEYGGAPLMGISKPVIKAHGSSNANAYKNAIRQAIAFCNEHVIDEITQNFAPETNG